MPVFSLDKYERMKPLFTQGFDISNTVNALAQQDKELGAASDIKKSAAIEGTDVEKRDENFGKYFQTIDEIASSDLDPWAKTKSAKRIASQYVNDTLFENLGKSVVQKQNYEKEIDDSKELSNDRKDFAKGYSLWKHNTTGGTIVDKGQVKTYDNVAYAIPENRDEQSIIKTVLTPGSGLTTNRGTYYYDATNGGFATKHVDGRVDRWKNGEAVSDAIWEDQSSGIKDSKVHDSRMQLAAQLMAKGEYNNLYEAFDATTDSKNINALNNIVNEQKKSFTDSLKVQTEYEKEVSTVNYSFQRDPKISAGGAGGKMEVPIVNSPSTYTGSKVKILSPELTTAVNSARNSNEYMGNLKKELQNLEYQDKKASNARTRYDLKYKGGFLKYVIEGSKNGADSLLSNYGYTLPDLQKMSREDKDNVLKGILNQDYNYSQDIGLSSTIVDINKAGDVFSRAFTQDGHYQLITGEGDVVEVPVKDFKQYTYDNSALGFSDEADDNLDHAFESVSKSRLILNDKGEAPKNDNEAYFNLINNIKTGNAEVNIVPNPDLEAVKKGGSPFKYGIKTDDGGTFLASMDNETSAHSKQFSDLYILAKTPLDSKRKVVNLPNQLYSEGVSLAQKEYRGLWKLNRDERTGVTAPQFTIQLKDGSTWTDTNLSVEQVFANRLPGIPGIANNIFNKADKIQTQKVDTLPE